MKILNIDKLAENTQRVLVIFGKKHQIKPMTVGNFIETTTVAEAMREEQSLVKQVEATVDMIVRSVPTAPRDELLKLELPQLQAITAFVRGDEVEGAEEVSAKK